MNILSKPILHLISDVVGSKGIKPGQFNLENTEGDLAGDAYLANFNNLIETLEQTGEFELPKEFMDLNKQFDLAKIDLEKMTELPNPGEELDNLEMEPLVADLTAVPVLTKPAEAAALTTPTANAEDPASAPPAMFKELNAAFNKLKQAEVVDGAAKQSATVEKNIASGAAAVELPKTASANAVNATTVNLAEVRAAMNQAPARVAAVAEEVASNLKDARPGAKVEAPGVSVVSVVKTPVGQVPFLPQVTIKGLPDFVVREITALRFERPDQATNPNNLAAQSAQRSGRSVELQLVP
ncbi:MAG: hypothetical protein AAGF54_16690, partial [Pseudomonadota bacterium]